MIQNYLAEPLVKNYTAPQYPIFICLKNSIYSLNHKKSARDVKADITSVHILYIVVNLENWAIGLKICVDFFDVTDRSSRFQIKTKLNRNCIIFYRDFKIIQSNIVIFILLSLDPNKIHKTEQVITINSQHELKFKITNDNTNCNSIIIIFIKSSINDIARLIIINT
jgi:hypothetical protein